MNSALQQKRHLTPEDLKPSTEADVAVREAVGAKLRELVRDGHSEACLIRRRYDEPELRYDGGH